MMTTKKPVTSQFQTWINYLSSLGMTLEYQKGILHGNADMLSRPSCEPSVQCQTLHEEAKKGKIKTRLLNEISVEKNIGTTKETEREETGAKLWIAETQITRKIQEIHKLLCHAGVEKVREYMNNKFAGHRLDQRVKEVVRSCEICQKTKGETAPTKEETVNSEKMSSFEVVYIDICGPLRETKGKKKYIFGMIDQYSKYIVLTALTRQDEGIIVESILKKWILRFGCPRILRSDSGRVFESKGFKDFADKLMITLQTSSPYHHNSNGQIERQFRTVREWLNASMKERNTTA